jgi:hypothetical protein
MFDGPTSAGLDLAAARAPVAVELCGTPMIRAVALIVLRMRLDLGHALEPDRPPSRGTARTLWGRGPVITPPRSSFGSSSTKLRQEVRGDHARW